MRMRFLLPLVVAAGACGTTAVPGNAPPPTVLYHPIEVCVVQGGALTRVLAQFHPATGDTSFGTPDGPLAREHDFAAEKTWYIDNESIRVDDRLFRKVGLPRMLEVGDVIRVGEYDGVPVFAEPGETLAATYLLYLPVRRGCEFQMYDGSLDVRLDDKPGSTRKKPPRVP